jgi:hypothetical protein
MVLFHADKGSPSPLPIQRIAKIGEHEAPFARGDPERIALPHLARQAIALDHVAFGREILFKSQPPSGAIGADGDPAT